MSRSNFDVNTAAGAYRVHKGNGWRRGVTHDRFAAAEAEALRLAEANPGASFIITREVARIERSGS